MSSSKPLLSIRSWNKEQYLLSTDASLIPETEFADILDSDDFYWAKTIPVEYIRQMLDSSMCFGLYDLANTSEKASSLVIQRHPKSDTFKAEVYWNRPPGYRLGHFRVPHRLMGTPSLSKKGAWKLDGEVHPGGY